MDNTQLQWALNALNAAGYQTQTTTPDLVQDNPWSEVYRFQTDRGRVYFKRVPEALSIEPQIIRILHQDFQAAVPLIIADNPKQFCFLMQDAGMSLHDYFKDQFKAELLIQALRNYTEIQQKSLSQIEPFLNQGIPDWRLAHLPVLYQALIEQEALLIQDGLTASELKKLRELKQRLVSLCEQLSSYAIQDSLSHCDFHDKNILVNPHTDQTTLIDLGEVAIVHPFFSLLNCIHRAKENFQLSQDQYQELQDEGLKLWLPFESQAHLKSIFSLILKCWPIQSVLGEYRLITSVDPQSRPRLARQGRLANNLRHWLRLSE